MIRSLLVLYNPFRLSATLVYMLQNTEYVALPYLRWFWRTQDFSSVMYRRTLDRTKAARLLTGALLVGMGLQILTGIAVILLWQFGHLVGGLYFGLALLLSFPVVWAHIVVIPLILGREFITKPQQASTITASKAIFANHKAARIAIAGSYGKTSMKELLLTVLSEGKNVAATPANKNVAISHAYFAAKLTGKEDILLLEYGEGHPGDVQKFAETTQPTHGIITGLAPAHLDQYKTVAAAGEDIFSLARYLDGKQVFVNADSASTHIFMQPGYYTYDASGALRWKVKDIVLSIHGTTFTLTKGKRTLRLRSALLGKHQVGPLSLAAALGIELGLTDKQVIAGIGKTTAYEHRMQAYAIGGATVIDDTYNGNIEGVRVGTELLAALPAKRKWYVTPGLVDQGNQADLVHEEMGKLIAAAKPDIIVLMQNSATAAITAGLQSAGFAGEVRIETAPLDFYTSLEHQVAAGDLVLMQNDWTDNYA
jgi:UDP-N-acetylmuramyl pentapeptide synthase